MNQLSSETGVDQRSFMVWVERPERSEAAAGPGGAARPRGYCAPYNGAVCRNYIRGRGLVWFNISQDNAGGWRNEEITMAVQEELIGRLEEPCRYCTAVVQADCVSFLYPD